MYPVSSVYKEKIQELNRTFELDIKIYHSNGVLQLSDKDIVQGSLIHSESSQYGEDFTIGGVVASDISMEILRKPEHEDVDFMGARLEIIIELYVNEEIEAHFLQPSQPSKMPNTNADIERVPLGKFNIDVANKKPNTIVIKAIDNMINLDKPYSLSKLSYPATLYQIYTNICNVADVQIGTFNFPNMDYVVSEKPIGDYTLRDILSYVAELSGGFARFNRYGDLEISWYTPTDTVIHPKNRYDLESSDDLIQITGVAYEVDDVVYLTGTDSYAIDISENPLLQDNYDIVLPNILSNIDKVILKPYTSNWQGNPAIQAGDIISHIDKDGNAYTTIVTNTTYKYRGKSVLKGSGLHASNKGFNGSSDKRINKIIQQLDNVIGDKLTTLEQAQLNATELMANMLGGYIIEDRENGILYIADNPDLELATKIWKWGTGGFGYSSDGGQTYTTAVTADGSIVAELISAGIITANMVQTGLLSSEDGSTWINLDNGSFNLKDKIKFVNNKFNMSLEGTDANNEVDSKINTAKSSMEQYADGIKSTVESNVASTYETKSGVTTKINTAKSEVNQYADSIVSSVRTTANSASSKADSAQSTANSANSKASTAITNASTAIQTADTVSFTFTQLKNLSTGQELSGGSTTINRNGIRVDHLGLGGQYSEMNADGFIRKWRYGDAKYLNDIYMEEVRNIYGGSQGREDMPPDVTVTLPVSFRGRGSEVDIIVFPSDMRYYGGSIWGDDTIEKLAHSMRARTSVVGKYLNAATPYVNISSFTSTEYSATSRVVNDAVESNNGFYYWTRYWGMDFVIAVIGK